MLVSFCLIRKRVTKREFNKMTKFVDVLSEKSKENWAVLYKKVKGKKWIPPVKDKPESVDKQGREG